MVKVASCAWARVLYSYFVHERLGALVFRSDCIEYHDDIVIPSGVLSHVLELTSVTYLYQRKFHRSSNGHVRRNGEEWSSALVQRLDINVNAWNTTTIDQTDMSRCTLESLPNELILLIFEYLSLFDLYQAFSQISNTRLVQLLRSKRHPFVVGSLRCGQICQLLDANNEGHLKCLTDLIDTLGLDDSLGSSVFLEHVTKRMDVTQPLSCRLSSMTQLIILKADRRDGQTIRSLLLPLNFCNHSLRRVHLVFQRPADQYVTVLSTLVSNRISFHTMTLEVENGR